MGFNNCPLFTRKGTIEEWTEKIKAPLGDCPLCGWKEGNYCMNEMRMVTKVRVELRLGRMCIVGRGAWKLERAGV